MKHSFPLEQELFEPIVTYFEQHHCIVASEVHIGFCRADVVAFHPDKTVSAVELKLSDWKKALIQAKNYQLGADYVYVVFPLAKCPLVLQRAQQDLTENGIGLFVVDEVTKNVQRILSAAMSQRKIGTLTLDEVWLQKTTSKTKKEQTCHR